MFAYSFNAACNLYSMHAKCFLSNVTQYDKDKEKTPVVAERCD